MATNLARPDTFSRIRDWAPPEVLELLDQVLLLLPGEIRDRLGKVIDSLPEQGDNLSKVLELVRSQWQELQSQDWTQIAVVGPGQTGKSTLVRSIRRGQREPLLPIFTVVDLQGLDEYLGYGRDRPSSEDLELSEVILLVLDARYEVSESTRQMQQRLRAFNKPVLVVLNKIDLAGDPSRALREARRELKAQVLGVSALKAGSLDKLLPAIVSASPRTLFPLTQNFPAFRRAICRGIVTQSAFAAGLAGAIPIPVSQLIPITAIQTGMMLKIARAFGHELSWERGRELLPLAAATALVQEAGRRLQKNLPLNPSLVSVSVAGSWTFLAGHAAIRYFERISDFLEAPAV